MFDKWIWQIINIWISWVGYNNGLESWPDDQKICLTTVNGFLNPQVELRKQSLLFHVVLGTNVFNADFVLLFKGKISRVNIFHSKLRQYHDLSSFQHPPLSGFSVEVEGTFQQEIRVIDPDAIWQFVDRQGGASNLNVLNLVCFFSQISANYIEVFEVQWDPAPNPPFCFDSNLLVVASPGIENWTMPSHCPIAHCQYCCWRRINTVLISKARSFQWRALRESIQFVKFILLSYLTCIEADIHAFYSRQALADIALVTYTCENKCEIQKSAVTFNKRSEVVAFDRLGIMIFQSRTWLAFQDYDRWI